MDCFYSFSLLLTFFLAYSALAEPCSNCDASACQCARPRNCRPTMDVLGSCQGGGGLVCCPDADILVNHKRIEAWPQFRSIKQLNYIEGSWIDYPEGQRRTTTTTTTTSTTTAAPDEDDGECGTRPFNRERISGGEKAEIGDYPWIVALRYRAKGNSSDERNLCAGSLISRQHVLTAAHCLKIAGYNLVSVVAGEHDIRQDPDCVTKDGLKKCSHIVVVPIESTVPHRRYTIRTFANDIAVVKLQREVDITPTVRTICLPSNDTKLAPGDSVLIAGWGKTSSDAPPSPVLLHTSIEVKDFEGCAATYRQHDRSIVSPQMFCAGNGTRDSCKGDSGGPLMAEFNGKYHVMGLVSFGYKEYCGLSRVPGVYANVTNYVTWINDSMVLLDTTN